jgi:hypothetical protein
VAEVLTAVVPPLEAAPPEPPEKALETEEPPEEDPEYPPMPPAATPWACTVLEEMASWGE